MNDTRTVITDDELADAFAGTNFGDRDHRELLEVSVLKKAVGFHCGHTITEIMKYLGLIGVNETPTKKGKRLLQVAWSRLIMVKGG